MIFLKDRVIIGQGTNRACYEHPEDASRCIKVTISGNPSESKKEQQYYKLLKKKKVSWEMLAQYYGEVRTDLGDGLVFDLIRDYDGKVSQTIQYYLSSEEKLSAIANPIILLQELKQYQLDEGIIIKDLNAKNIMYQKLSPTHGCLMVIDGVSNNDFLAFSSHINFLTKKKILRRWKTFQDSFFMNKKFKNNRLFFKMLKDNPF